MYDALISAMQLLLNVVLNVLILVSRVVEEEEEEEEEEEVYFYGTFRDTIAQSIDMVMYSIT